jgi:ketosteroid isomerase-like protein
MDAKSQILSTIDAMTRAFNAGDIEGIMRTYEPGAVVLGEPDVPVSGASQLRAMFAGFIAAKAHFTFSGHEVVQADDIALHLTPWRMSGVGPDGKPVEMQGLSIAVLRRQSDGRWLMVIDDPHGDALLRQARSS